MSGALATYLHDHLAGSHFAVQLLGTLRDEHKDEPLGSFSADLLAEIQDDQQVLEAIIHRIGETHIDLKDIAAWVAEKASQLKLRRDRAGGLGTFEAMEALALGIIGKLELWKALPVVAEKDSRLVAWDFERLATRAKDQFLRIEKYRLELARTAFHDGSAG
jgi:hypothetical protein